jgi:putative transcriptional regulator
MIKYDKLFQKLEEKKITTYFIRKNKITGEATLTKLRNNEPVTTATIDKFCALLDCQPADIMEYVPDTD